MSQWYGEAKLCIAYLSDVNPVVASKDDLKVSSGSNVDGHCRS